MYVCIYVCRKQLKPVYISGMPGTGKTATVLAAVNSLKEEVRVALCHTGLYVCMYVYMHVCMYSCICMYICMCVCMI